MSGKNVKFTNVVKNVKFTNSVQICHTLQIHIGLPLTPNSAYTELQNSTGPNVQVFHYIETTVLLLQNS